MEFNENQLDIVANSNLAIEKELVAFSRESFEENYNASPIEALLSEEWIDITDFPIGMKDDGTLFFEYVKKEIETNIPQKIAESFVSKTENINEIVPQKKPWWKFW